eukprot:8815290-Ditylum_brightwellii.AAC.1
MPNCPVLKKHPSGTKQDAIEISDTTTGVFGTKTIVGETGVSLRYQIAEEYDALHSAQRDKLHEHCENMFNFNEGHYGRIGQGQGHGYE